MTRKIIVKNRSDWPTAVMNIICPWIAKEAGITWKYEFLIRDCKSMTWGGRGAREYQRVWLDRHYRRGKVVRKCLTNEQYTTRVKAARRELAKEIQFLRKDEYSNGTLIDIRHADPSECPEDLQPLMRRYAALERAQHDRWTVRKAPMHIAPNQWPLFNKDHRFKWSENQTFLTRLELLVFLIAHEACHATTGHPDQYREAGQKDVAGMEFHCNAKGYRIIEQFHQEWPTFRPLIYAAMRKERAKKQRKTKARFDPNPKLALAQLRLADWQRRQRAANNKVKKYARQVKYYQGKLAARSSGSSNAKRA